MGCLFLKDINHRSLSHYDHICGWHKNIVKLAMRVRAREHMGKEKAAAGFEVDAISKTSASMRVPNANMFLVDCNHNFKIPRLNPPISAKNQITEIEMVSSGPCWRFDEVR